LLIAFTLAGFGIYTNYIAVICAKKGFVKSFIYGNCMDYEKLITHTYIYLNIAGILFAVALMFLAATGMSRLLVSHDKTANTSIELMTTDKLTR